MGHNKKQYTVNDAWKDVIEKYNLIERVQQDGVVQIQADQLKEFKEPRLMAKWDTSKALPEILRKHNMNILPDSRGSYVVGDFLLYEEIPEPKEPINLMAHVEFPDFESIDIHNIHSEASAIQVLLIARILDDFLGSENTSTFHGRMGTGVFDFYVDTYRNIKRKISVKNVQCEIDGGFENDESVVIMEAKNVVHEDFHIRQLYYPYRLWKTKVHKPIRLVFSVYSNMIYRLYEYRFHDLEDYSSIELVQTKNYSLQDTEITEADLLKVRNQVSIKTNDNMHTPSNKERVPFIQADSMDRVISLLENLFENPMTTEQIAELMDFDIRQSDYYFNAGKYLGLFEKDKVGQKLYVKLTSLGTKIFKMSYKERQLKMVALMLEHTIFTVFFDQVIESGELPNKSDIMYVMKELQVCGEGQIARRASSVMGWLKWMYNLTKL